MIGTSIEAQTRQLGSRLESYRLASSSEVILKSESSGPGYDSKISESALDY